MSKPIGLLGLKAALLMAATLYPLLTAVAQNQPGVSLSALICQPNGPSYALSATSDFRYVLFRSDASNLVPGDTNGVTDLFLVDTTLKSVELVTRPPRGQSNGATRRGMIADTGAIVIETLATNLGGISDTNNLSDILYRAPGGTTWQYLSTDAAGTPVGGRDPFLSRDGKWVAWVQADQIWLYDTTAGRKSTLPLPQIVGGTFSVRPESLSLKGFSANGRHILFLVDVQERGSRYWSRRLIWYDRDGDGNGVYDDVVVAGRVHTNIISEDPARLSSVTAVMATGGYTIALAAEDGVYEVLVRDLLSGRSISFNTGVADSPTFALSDDGRYIVYLTMSTLIGDHRVYLGDTVLGTSQLVSIDANGGRRGVDVPNSFLVSDTGNQVVFSAPDSIGSLPSVPWVFGDTNRQVDVLIRDIAEARTHGLTVGPCSLNNEAAGSVHIDRIGARAVFASPASNLVSGDTNNVSDIFIRFPDGSLRRIMAHNGAEPNGPSFDPRISSDGNWVTFRSYATNLTPEGGNGKSQIYLYSIATNQIWLVSRSSLGALGNEDSQSPSISRDGLFIAFASSASNLVGGDYNNDADIFLYSRLDGRLTRITPRQPDGEPNDPDGPSGDPVISDDGQWIAFGSPASNYVMGDTNGTDDIFLYNRATFQFRRITQGGVQLNGASYQVSISGDGRYVAFASQATNIDSRDTDSLPDIYVWDRQTGVITLASVNSFGRKANLGGRRPSISHDGRLVAFESDATNLMPLDGTPDTDIFVYNTQAGWVYPVSVRGCIPGESPSFVPVISGDGRMAAFQTTATNLSDLPIGANAYVVIQRVLCTPPGDVNRDGVVDDADLLQVLFDFGQESSCADVTMDGIVDDADLLVVLFNFGLQCSGQFLHDDDGERRRIIEALLGETTEVAGYADEDSYHYHGTSMTPALLKSLERQAAEINMMHQGRWPYPVAGLGSEPWIAAYGDPLTMSEEELQALLDQFHNPPQQDEGDFSPAAGSAWSYNQSKSVVLGGADINISVNGSILLWVSCAEAKMEAKGDAKIKFFSLNYTVAEAYGFAGATNAQAKLHAYFKVAGSTLWSFGPQTWNLAVTRASQCHYGGSQSNIGPWSKSWSFTKTWFLGPVPVKVTAGINLQAGACYKLHAQLAPIKAEARFRPYVNSSAFASGGVSISAGCWASGGVGINLTLLNYALEAYVTGEIGMQGNRCCAVLNAGIDNTITTLRGRFFIFAEACCWGLSGDRCGVCRKRQRWEWDLFNWGGFSSSGHLWGPWTYTHCFK
jgi:Tol biopolymer transport system component